MAEPTTRELLERLATLEGRLAAREAGPARHFGWRHHGRAARRLPTLALVALLVALVPLATLAANPFADLNPGSPHNGNIDAIYNAGITTGCEPGARYCPNGLVSREEMASFLARTAGLGNNPPVVNAKTAQTAQTASTATSAGNANTVGGYAPNGLVRVARGTGYTSLPFASLNTASFTTLAATTLTLPGPGFVLVTASVRTVAPAQAPTNAYVETRLRDAGPGGQAAPELVTTVGTDAEYAYQIPASPTYVFAVNAAGPRTFVLESRVVTGGVGRAGDAVIAALYVPFGSTGGAALDTDAP